MSDSGGRGLRLFDRSYQVKQTLFESAIPGVSYFDIMFEIYEGAPSVLWTDCDQPDGVVETQWGLNYQLFRGTANGVYGKHYVSLNKLQKPPPGPGPEHQLGCKTQLRFMYDLYE